MKGERKEGFFSILGRAFDTISCMNNPQFTGLDPNIAPNMVLAMVRLIRLGLPGFRMGSRNSSTLPTLLLRQFPGWKPSLGSLLPLNFPV